MSIEKDGAEAGETDAKLVGEVWIFVLVEVAVFSKCLYEAFEEWEGAGDDEGLAGAGAEDGGEDVDNAGVEVGADDGGKDVGCVYESVERYGDERDGFGGELMPWWRLLFSKVWKNASQDEYDYTDELEQLLDVVREMFVTSFFIYGRVRKA